MDISEFDGFYFLPGDEDNQMKFAYFKVNENLSMGEKVNNTKVGDMYHIAFFKEGDNGHPEFDEEFEAIFADPTVYVSNLIGQNLYGCIFRKTENSNAWWDDYLNRAKENCKEIQMKHALKANN